MTETDKIVAEISEKLGVRLSYREETAAEKAESYSCGAKSDGRHTYFRFTCGEKTYTGVLDGATRTEKNYAALLPSYIASSVGKHAELSRADFLKKNLLGECSSADAYKYAVKFSVADTPRFVLALKFPKAYADALTLLNQYGDEKNDCAVQFDDKNYAFVKSVSTAEEYASLVDYAEFLARFVAEELGVRICVGVGSIAKDFHDLSRSYTRALSALKYAEVFSGGEGVHSYKEYMLVKLLEDVPETRLAEFMEDVSEEQEKEVFEDEEMLLTAEKFLNSSLNVSETSRSLYMHRNTLLYRLDKIEKTTGLNIRLFPDAVTFRILTVLYKLSKK